MSAVFPVETYQPPVGGAWPIQDSGSHHLHSQSPSDAGFPKQEMFDDVDLSEIPLSMLSDPSVQASSLDSMAFSDTSFVPHQQQQQSQQQRQQQRQQQVAPGVASSSPPFYLPPRPTAAMRQAETPPQSRIDQTTAPVHSGSRAGEQSCSSTPVAVRRPSSGRYSPRKRKSTSSATWSSRSSTSPPAATAAATATAAALQPRKATHNMIEKRYRTNLNDKIVALRDAVPSLRVMAHRLGHDVEGLDEHDLMAEAESMGRLTPPQKLNKATVLSKATEYIAHLESNNEILMHENTHLRNRLAGLEMMLMGRGSAYNGVWG